MAETHSEKRLIGYARVSTYGQTLDSQLEQLRDAGCSDDNIYKEKVTGAHSDRRQLLKMLDDLDTGDVVTVTRIDRFEFRRSTSAIYSACSASSILLSIFGCTYHSCVGCYVGAHFPAGAPVGKRTGAQNAPVVFPLGHARMAQRNFAPVCASLKTDWRNFSEPHYSLPRRVPAKRPFRGFRSSGSS
jgi:hypothetical protein